MKEDFQMSVRINIQASFDLITGLFKSIISSINALSGWALYVEEGCLFTIQCNMVITKALMTRAQAGSNPALHLKTYEQNLI